MLPSLRRLSEMLSGLPGFRKHTSVIFTSVNQVHENCSIADFLFAGDKLLGQLCLHINNNMTLT